MYADIKTFLTNEENMKSEISEHRSKIEQLEQQIEESWKKHQDDKQAH